MVINMNRSSFQIDLDGNKSNGNETNKTKRDDEERNQEQEQQDQHKQQKRKQVGNGNDSSTSSFAAVTTGSVPSNTAATVTSTAIPQAQPRLSSQLVCGGVGSGSPLQGSLQSPLQSPLQVPSSNPTMHPSIPILVPQPQVPPSSTAVSATAVPFLAHQHQHQHINDAASAASAYAQSHIQAVVTAASQQHLVSALAHQQAVVNAMNTVGVEAGVGAVIQQNPTSILNVPQYQHQHQPLHQHQHQQQQTTGALLENHFATSLAGVGHGHGHNLLNALKLSSPQNIISGSMATVPTVATTATTTATTTMIPTAAKATALPTSISAPTQNLNVKVNVTPSIPQSIPLPNPSLGLTVQDHPHKSPIYNGVNPNYPNLNVLNQNPPIFSVTNFLTSTECDFLINVAQDCFSPAPVVGKGAGEVSPSRTSSTCYLAREDLPRYLAKVCALTGKPVEHCELPQVGRYYPSQQYLQHFDAFDLSNEDGRRFASNGGQRTVTVLVYLNDVKRGGTTFFPNLNLDVRPQKGMALVFFPSTVDGFLDKNALHAAKPAIDTKYVSQVWIRQGRYEGLPSKRMFSSVDQAMLVQKSLIAAREGSVADDEIAMCIPNSVSGVATGIGTGSTTGIPTGGL